MDITKFSAGDAVKQIKNKEISVLELTDSYLNRIKEVDDRVKAFIQVDAEGARARARELDGSTVNELGGGLPIAIKDNINLIGAPTTCASKILKNYRPVYNAHVIEKLIRGDAVFIGKTNLDEFAMGSSTENSSFGPTHNPWDIERVPGGSSGGSAAAIAAREALWAIGSDTGGSIRQPAAFCGVVGLKPTYGLVSRYGLVAFASSLDQIGPITKTVDDSALLLSIIAGHDRRDSTSLDYEIPDYLANPNGDLSDLKVGLPIELFSESFDEGVKVSVKKAIEILEKKGAKIEETSLSSIEYALSTYYIIAPAEASSNLSRYDGVRYGFRSNDNSDIIEMYKDSRSGGFGQEVKRRIMLGTYALSAGYYDAYYGKAQKVRTMIIEDFKSAFSKYDVLISPTTPTTAFKKGEKTNDPLQMYLSDICTIPANLAGIPAISIPCGLSDNLPVGLQIMADHYGEATLFKVAKELEEEIGFSDIPEL